MTPSDEELDALIRARLALVGVDLEQLPEQPDPVTGAPTRAQALAALRTFLAGPLVGGERVGGTVRTVSAWKPPADGGTDEAALSQQVAPPAAYPAQLTAWTEEGS